MHAVGTAVTTPGGMGTVVAVTLTAVLVILVSGIREWVPQCAVWEVK